MEQKFIVTKSQLKRLVQKSLKVSKSDIFDIPKMLKVYFDPIRIKEEAKIFPKAAKLVEMLSKKQTPSKDDIENAKQDFRKMPNERGFLDLVKDIYKLLDANESKDDGGNFEVTSAFSSYQDALKAFMASVGKSPIFKDFLADISGEEDITVADAMDFIKEWLWTGQHYKHSGADAIKILGIAMLNKKTPSASDMKKLMS